MEKPVDTFVFSFPKHYHAWKYDEEFLCFKHLSSSMQFECECALCPSHSCKKKSCPSFQNCNRRKQNEGLKGVDIVALDDKQKFLFLIEAKDYRKKTNPPVDHIVAEVAKKFRDTLFGIWCGSCCDSGTSEKSFLYLIRTKPYSLMFVFHFESPSVPYPSGLHRSGKVVPIVSIESMLKRKLGPMSPYVKVCDMDTPRDCPWTVTERT